MSLKVIALKADGGGARTTLLHPGFHTLDLDLDPDTALEHVRIHLSQRWAAKTHALRWIHPNDHSIPTDDPAPFLVVHVDSFDYASSERWNDQSVTCLSQHANPVICSVLQEAQRRCCSEPWSEPEWLSQMESWIAKTFGQSTIQQIRVRSTGAVLKVKTKDATYFLKTLPCFLGYEAQLLPLLDLHFPGACPAVHPARPEPNSHITAEIKGTSLQSEGDIEDWEAALEDIGTMQRKTVPFVSGMRGAGVPGRPFASFAAQIDEMLNTVVVMQAQADNALTPVEVDKVDKLARRAINACETLGDCALPDSLVHGDPNPSNIFRTSDGRTTAIDWTLAHIGHPFFAATLLFDVHKPDHPFHSALDRLRLAYLRPWRSYASTGCLLSGMDAATRLFWVQLTQVVMELVPHMESDYPGIICDLPRLLRRCVSEFGLGD